MSEGFERQRITVDGVDINLVWAGEGPPVLLLHGYPQSHVEWHKMAPILAERYSVVAPDLRGYGDSDKPEAPEGDLSVCCKRTTANDQVRVMIELGFEAWHVVGHDRGARVGHRMALDNPDRVLSFTCLDIEHDDADRGRSRYKARPCRVATFYPRSCPRKRLPKFRLLSTPFPDFNSS